MTCMAREVSVRVRVVDMRGTLGSVLPLKQLSPVARRDEKLVDGFKQKK